MDMKTEIAYLAGILEDAGVSEARRKTLAPIIENVALMRFKLCEAFDEVKDAPLVESWENGKQAGIKESSIVKAYESLFKHYMVGMAKILDALPAEKRAEVEREETEVRPQTVLEIIRGRHA